MLYVLQCYSIPTLFLARGRIARYNQKQNFRVTSAIKVNNNKIYMVIFCMYVLSNLRWVKVNTSTALLFFGCLFFHMHAFKALDLSDHRVIKCLLCTHRLNSCQKKKLPKNFGYSWYFFWPKFVYNISFKKGFLIDNDDLLDPSF